MTAVLAEDAPECREAEVWLGLYLDDELLEEERARVQQHLAACPQCQHELRLLERSRVHLRRQADAVSLPAGLEDKVRATIAQEAKRGGSAGRVVAAVAAGIVLVGGAVVFAAFGTDARGPNPGAARAERVLQGSVAQHALDLPVDIASADPVRVERYLRPRVGPGVSVPALEAQGFSLRGGRVVSLEDRSAAQLVYQGGLGRKLSVTVVPDVDAQVSEAAVSADVKAPEQGGVRAVKVGRTLYTVAGDVSDDVLGLVSSAIAGASR